MKRKEHSGCRLIASLSALALLMLGCASPPPTIDTSPGAEVSFDGLHRVLNSSADEAWARPDLDLSGFTKIRVVGVGIEFRPGGESGRSWTARSRGGPFEVTEQQKVQLARIVAEAFLEELEKSEHFTIVEENGPDVLLIRGALLDVVSYVPPEGVGRSDVFLRQVGEATLVLEIRDSITDTILVRAVDRRAAERAGGELMRSNVVNNVAEVRRLARRWASTLRQRLDEFMAAG